MKSMLNISFQKKKLRNIGEKGQTLVARRRDGARQTMDRLFCVTGGLLFQVNIDFS